MNHRLHSGLCRRGHQQETSHGSPQTSRPWRPGRRGLYEREAGRHKEVSGTLWSPHLGVQKPWQLDQGKQFQEVALLGPLTMEAATQHSGLSVALCRSGRATWAGLSAGDGDAG